MEPMARERSSELSRFSIHILMLTALPLVGFGMPKDNGLLSLTSPYPAALA